MFMRDGELTGTVTTKSTDDNNTPTTKGSGGVLPLLPFPLPFKFTEVRVIRSGSESINRTYLRGVYQPPVTN